MAIEQSTELLFENEYGIESKDLLKSDVLIQNFHSLVNKQSKRNFYLKKHDEIRV
jgi:hypothetical protein